MEEGKEQTASLKPCQKALGKCAYYRLGPFAIVAVEARLGFFRDRIVDGRTEFEVRREPNGWRSITDPRGGGGRVRYSGWRDVVTIESPHGSLRIQFRWWRTTFTWRGQVYRIQSTWSGETILRGDQPVVKARSSWRGVRLESLDPEFRDIERELALGLGYRIMAMAVALGAV